MSRANEQVNLPPVTLIEYNIFSSWGYIIGSIICDRLCRMIRLYPTFISKNNDPPLYYDLRRVLPYQFTDNLISYCRPIKFLQDFHIMVKIKCLIYHRQNISVFPSTQVSLST